MKPSHLSLNYYQRLAELGWVRASGNRRYDFYRKGRWTCIVPRWIDAPIKFTRQ